MPVPEKKSKSTRSGSPAPAPAKSSPYLIYGAAAVLVILTFIVYWPSFSAPFLLDDGVSIINNPSIRHLTALPGPWVPPANGQTVSGRPLLNVSLAVNYALGRLNPRGYHAANLAIHLTTGLLLFGLVRRTLRKKVLRDKFGEADIPLAFAIALLWLVHPLQTESVTYVIQRAESLTGMFYFLTLYAFSRGTKKEASVFWKILAVGACLAGMMCKEVMATAPLVVLLYDRTFVAGTFVDAWRRRRIFYCALASTWLVLAALILTSSQRGDTVGFSLNMPWWQYTLKQCEAIVVYLKLTVWPHPLVLDYGWAVVSNPLTVAPQIILLGLLLIGTIYALWKKPLLGFIGAFFFLVLAPSSSVVPVTTQTMAEHRMYIPLAALVAIAILSAYSWLGRRSLIIWGVVALLFGGVSFARNRDYQSLLSIWTDTAQKCPDNARAHCELGNVYYRAKRFDDALREYNLVWKLCPEYPDTQNDIGLAQEGEGNAADAMLAFAKAVELFPAYAPAHFDYGNALFAAQRLDDAEAQYRAALKIFPDYAEAHNNLGAVLSNKGKSTEAIAEFQAALHIDPNYKDAKNNLAHVQAQANAPGK